MTRILITGGTGFIGRALIPLLSHYSLRLVVRQPCSLGAHEYVRADLAQPESLKGLCQDIDTVYHLAGLAHTTSHTSTEYERINTQATQCLYQEALRCGVKNFIFLSSVRAATATLEEAYGYSKQQAEQSIPTTATMNVFIIRPALVYGPGVKGNLATLIKLTQKRVCPPIPDVRHKKSMIALDDLVNILVEMPQHTHLAGKILTLSDNQTYTTRRLYTSILHACEQRVSRYYIPFRCLQFVAILGDFITKRGLPFPLTQEKLHRIFQDDWYPCSPDILTTYKWFPRFTFEHLVLSMLIKYD